MLVREAAGWTEKCDFVVWFGVGVQWGFQGAGGRFFAGLFPMGVFGGLLFPSGMLCVAVLASGTMSAPHQGRSLGCA